MDQQPKTPRKRVANFTADEKALLAQLIKKKPIIESTLTDGKSVAKKVDSDGTILCSINNTEVDSIDIGGNETITAVSSMDTSDINKDVELDITVPRNETQNITDNSAIIKTEPVRRPTDYIRWEAVMRIKYMENKKNLEMKIRKTQLEVEEIRKRSALLEEERNKIILEKTKIEYDLLKK